MATQENSSSSSSSSSNQPKIGKWVPRRLQQQQHNFHEFATGRVSPQNKGRNYSSIPDHVRKSVSMNEIPDILLRGLSLETYTEYFITLLALDDLYAEEVSKRTFDKVTMKTIDTKWAVLTVPGLQEKGYSPLVKDYIQVKPSQKKCMPYKQTMQMNTVRRSRERFGVCKISICCIMPKEEKTNADRSRQWKWLEEKISVTDNIIRMCSD